MYGFWTEGPDNYEQALREQYASRRAELRRRMKQTTDLLERAQLDDDLRRLRREFRAQLDGISRSLF